VVVEQQHLAALVAALSCLRLVGRLLGGRRRGGRGLLLGHGGGATAG